MPHLREHGYESGCGDASVARADAHAPDRADRERQTRLGDALRIDPRRSAPRSTCRVTPPIRTGVA